MRKEQVQCLLMSLDVISCPSLGKFDQDLCEMEIVKLFIEVELPFRLVEHPAFRRYSYTL